jgi:hypothetical protein
MGTYYVDSTTASTNWANATNIATPCTPLTAFANTVADDIVYFRGGSGDNYDAYPDYYEDPYFQPTNSGTSGHPITFKNYPGETPIIRNKGSDYTGFPVIGTSGKNWIVFDGFQFGDSQNYTVEGIPTMRIQNASTNITVRNCVWKCPNETSLGANMQAIYIVGSSTSSRIVNTTITNCYFSGGMNTNPSVHYNSINMYYNDNTVIEYSTFENSFGGVNFKSANINSKIRYCFFRNLQDGIAAIKIATFVDTWSNISIYQNIAILEAINGGFIGTYNNAMGGTGAYIYNNSIYGSSGSYNGIYVDTESPSVANMNFWNNVLDRSGKAMRWQASNSPTYSDYNIYYNGQLFEMGGSNYTTLALWRTALGGQADGDEANSWYEAITWDNAGGTTPADYKFTSTNKNNGRGGAYSSVIGAYITGNEQIGYLEDTGSASIRGVRIIGGSVR